MSSIIDTLTHQPNDGFTFTVNVANPWVVQTSSGGNFICAITPAIQYFDWKDNVNILSIGLYLPLGFEFWPNENGSNQKPEPHTVIIQTRNASGLVKQFIPGMYNIPAANYELSIGAFIKPSDDLGEKWSLTAQWSIGPLTNRISMLNVPAALDGEIFGIQPIIKVEHTLPMLT